ncbi:MAG: RsbRD N-terminal domain-containing protein [Nitrospirae bacterium]|nr:RsbRD N-terminal domain-containing protein [Nitrospirota bacterium]
MALNNLLKEKEAVILKRWFDAILETYAPETANQLRQVHDPFANPASQSIRQCIEGIFRKITGQIFTEKDSLSLENMLKLRAIQDITPSQAVSFVFFLKMIIRDELKNEAYSAALYNKLLSLESEIDETALLCFDLYVKHRQKIYELKSEEIKRAAFMLLRKSNQQPCSMEER